MQITNDARDALKNIFQERNVKGVRVYFAGFGWGGPQVGLSLDEAETGDQVVTINEIQVALDPRIEEHSQTLTLDYDQQTDRLVITGDSNCC